jgi:hypothetical protein
VAKKLMGHLDPEVIHKLVRGNAIRMLHLDETYPERYGNG